MPSKYGHRLFGEALYSLLPPLDFQGSFTIPWGFNAQLKTFGIRRFQGTLNIPLVLISQLKISGTKYFEGSLNILFTPSDYNIGITYHFGGSLNIPVKLEGGLTIYLGPFWKPDVPVDEFWEPIDNPDGFWVPIPPPGEFWEPVNTIQSFWATATSPKGMWEPILQERKWNG